VGGDELDEAIMQYMRKTYNLIIGELTAERIKINIGSAYPVRDELRMEISGVEMNGRMLRTVTITGEEIRKALEEQVCCIAEKVRSVFEHCKPELAADLVNNGIMLAGGGALLAGLDRLLSEETGLPVFVAEDPLNAVAKGTGLLLNEEELWTYYEN
jgi:rod shape-determining protein MreB